MVKAAELEKFEKEFIDRKPNRCSKCKGRLKYLGGGYYQCFDCENTEIDDFGRIKDYIDENGPKPAIVIAENTGVPIDIVNGMLREGRLEIPEGSKVYIQCLSCGCSIRYGRYCPDCIRNKTNNLKGIYFNPEVGEKPKAAPKQDGKMHFLDFDN
ncbi:hypothetical protein [Pseudobutyrivibrio xylanivorans]|uniref:Uncharacterized protein n=1 Tax=Pseudobutyrivibrio xylanivorans TaxID=185007 RepID=A0A5P6VTJ8_PSEXY|nr:hypothetical protein [Pseudobutyrivibrio xylanivorans]QFJ55917.1 hypothetical protein FXF36_13975 [Pseudobutyrivibrio xylanivorans]